MMMNIKALAAIAFYLSGPFFLYFGMIFMFSPAMDVGKVLICLIGYSSAMALGRIYALESQNASS